MSGHAPAVRSPALLVVEDDELQRDLLYRLLKPRWNVFVAADIPEADKLLTRNPEIGILLCDYELPGESGLDFCKRLHDRRAPVVTILITGFARMDLLLEAINSSCLFRFIEKPFNERHLHALLEEAVKEFDARERALAERLALENKTLKTSPSFRQRISRSLQIIFGVGSFALATILVILLVVLVVGILIFGFLYLLKSTLGIDIFKDRHLDDFIQFL